MRIKELFAKDIDRSINGVIKVGQDDEALIEQELAEYVVTRELARHFADFFESYTAAMDVPTDKIGVWITGFFGSGKSHFLKMLSYLLANRVVAGRRAIDYFDGKIDDAMVLSQMKRAVGVPTEAILFNIDSKAGQWKEGATAKTALLRGFARVFYEHQGFYGLDFRLARLEAFVEKQGKTQEFRDAFARINGGDWLADRESYDFYEDDIVEVLNEVLGMSEEAARRFFEADGDEAIAPDKLVAEVKEYVERKAAENGGDFRLLFMADEVGQFIGDDVNLMLNLQTLVEELGAQCQGHVWVMVTSQEAIDKVVKVAGNDFSKIQGRFNTRLSLSSSSVDEVIKKRVLDKTDEANTVLAVEYEQKAPVLKNLFTFEDSQSDLIGYASEQDFQESYPFVAYQFRLMPKVFSEIRRHGNAGKHLASGERSMLSGFQESAQSIEAEESTALVPFWRFYDTLAKSLDHDIRQVIDRAEMAAAQEQGLRAEDVLVLKTLYLIHYIKDVSPTIGNIAVLMIDRMDVDKIALRESVKGSLDRLIRENYVARHGDTYAFLTDEEQDIEREIKDTVIDAASVIDRISKLVFDGIYPKRRYRLGSNDFAFDGYVDDASHGNPMGGMKLNIVTVANELSTVDSAELLIPSSGQALVVLRSDEDYYEVLANAARIEKYARTQNVAQLPETKQNIIRAKQREAANADKEAQAMIENAILGATVAVDGRLVDARAGKAEARLDEVLRELTSVVYTKADYVGASVGGEADVRGILIGASQEAMPGANERALQEMERFLEVKAQTHQPASFGDVQRSFQAKPFGWRETDIAALTARLMIDQKVTLERAGAPLNCDDPRTAQSLCKRSEWDNVQVRKRERIDEGLMVPARRLLKELTGQGAVPEDEDGLIRAVIETLGEKRGKAEELLRTEYAREDYPGREVVARGIEATKGVLEHASDSRALLRAFSQAQDDLLDFSEDFEKVESFFPNQQRLYDEALALSSMMESEAVYLADDQDALRAVAEVRTILEMPEPYGRIKDLRALMDRVNEAHRAVLNAHRTDLFDRIEDTRSFIEGYGTGKDGSTSLVSRADALLTTMREQASGVKRVVELVALSDQVSKNRDTTAAAIDEAAAAAARPHPAASSMSDVEAPPRASTPEPKALRRSDVCPPTLLTTPSEVDAYVANIRAKLLAAIDDCGSVRLKD